MVKSPAVDVYLDPQVILCRSPHSVGVALRPRRTFSAGAACTTGLSVGLAPPLAGPSPSARVRERAGLAPRRAPPPSARACEPAAAAPQRSARLGSPSPSSSSAQVDGLGLGLGLDFGLPAEAASPSAGARAAAGRGGSATDDAPGSASKPPSASHSREV